MQGIQGMLDVPCDVDDHWEELKLVENGAVQCAVAYDDNVIVAYDVACDDIVAYDVARKVWMLRVMLLMVLHASHTA